MKNHQILIVDDTPANIQVLGQTLAAKGYKIVIATNGVQALKAVEQSIPDLILLDVNMPEMDGFETCKRLKELKEFEDIPIIFLTARTDTEDIVNAFQVGGADYITKPFRPVELLARVHFQLTLKDKTAELNETNNKNKQLVRVLLHDLGNPIGAIKTANELSIEDKEASESMSHLISKAVDNCLNILTSVKKIYTVEDNKYFPELNSVSLLNVVESAIPILQHQLNKKNIKLDVSIPNDLKANIDENTFIHSVLNNLLTNAIKFSYPGSTIFLKAYKEDGKIFFSIKDNGIGMSKNLLNNIFDLNKPTSRPGTAGENGTGYGMPLVKKFVEIFGGKIEIKSKEKPDPSSGTEVILTLKEN